ncbi:MAG: SRPBCC family protein [Nitrospiraceae bacterium]|nr:SRPBCC family protein [Nitrospiraceae bacterium]
MITQSPSEGAQAAEPALSNSGERPLSQRRSSDDTLAWSTALGWFSIGLGLLELAAPRRLARSIGVDDHRLLVRSLGMREIISGVGILTQRQPAGWMWSRVAGDAMDLALLGAAFRVPGAGRRSRVALATAAVAGVTLADLFVSRRLTESGSHGGLVQVSQSVTINRTAEDLYAVWRRFENLPPMLPHLASVRAVSDTRSHWVVRGPAGTSVEWDADIVEDRPNQHIAWQALPDADIRHAGSVRFRSAPAQRGTEVTVTFDYVPPAGRLGSAVATLFGVEPAQQVYEGLRAFKQIMETGEILRSDASIHRGMHPAQPPAVGVSR